MSLAPTQPHRERLQINLQMVGRSIKWLEWESSAVSFASGGGDLADNCVLVGRKLVIQRKNEPAIPGRWMARN